MRVLDVGHRYELQNLESSTTTVLQFMKDPALHAGDGADGPTCQEVIRALIDRVQSLNAEKSWAGNADIIKDLRHALAGFEARALLRRVEKDNFEIETVPTSHDGHLAISGYYPAEGDRR